MLRSIGTKDGIILYHIRYDIVLSCFNIISVTSCGQPRCWLIGIGLVIKFGYIWVCCTSTPTFVTGVLGTIGCKEVMSYSFINLFNLSSKKRQFLNSCPTCWQYA